MSHTDRKAAHDAKRAQADEPYCADQQNGLPDLPDIERQPWPLPPAFEPLPVQPGTVEALEREHARRGGK